MIALVQNIARHKTPVIKQTKKKIKTKENREKNSNVLISNKNRYKKGEYFFFANSIHENKPNLVTYIKSFSNCQLRN